MAPIAVQRAVSGTNPNYAIGTLYAENCQRCVPAYALRRWGWNVEAMPYPMPGQSNPCLGGFECFDGVKVHGFLGGGKVLTLTDLQAAMQSGQEGDIYGIIWTWPNSQRGHVIACEIVNGVPVYIDPQINKIGSLVIPKRASIQYGYSYYKMEKDKISGTIDWRLIIKKAKP